MMRTLSIILLFFTFVLLTGCETEENSGPKQYVVYDFWAPWCPPCVAFGPTFEEWKTKYTKENVTFKKVNVDEDKELAEKFQIDVIPTMIVTANGKVIGRLKGGATQDLSCLSRNWKNAPFGLV